MAGFFKIAEVTWREEESITPGHVFAAKCFGSGYDVLRHQALEISGTLRAQFRYHAGFGRTGFRVAGKEYYPTG